MSEPAKNAWKLRRDQPFPRPLSLSEPLRDDPISSALSRGPLAPPLGTDKLLEPFRHLPMLPLDWHVAPAGCCQPSIAPRNSSGHSPILPETVPWPRPTC